MWDRYFEKSLDGVWLVWGFGCVWMWFGGMGFGVVGFMSYCLLILLRKLFHFWGKIKAFQLSLIHRGLFLTYLKLGLLV